MTPCQIAREHIKYCQSKGYAPDEVCQSIQVYLRDPTWTDTVHALVRRMRDMRDGVEFEPIKDRVREPIKSVLNG